MTTNLRDFPAERILVIKPSALGDIVHSLPVLTALRRRYPEAHISWVVNRSYEGLLQGHPDLDALLTFDRNATRAGLVATVRTYVPFFRQLRQQRFDLVIDLQNLFRSSLMALATRAPRRVGLSSAREGAAWFYTDVVPVADFNAIHAVDRYWLVAEALGVGDGKKVFRLPITEAGQAWAASLLQEMPRPWLMLAAGSRWMTKRWPPEHFAALTRRAVQRFGGSAIFVGSADESALATHVASRIACPSRILTGTTSLPQLIALLSRADVMLANDTGPLHLAAALGRPVVAPYTCTKVLLNGPYGCDASAVEARIWCQGSYLKNCDRLECMVELLPDRLWPVLEQTLLTWESNRRSA